MDEFLELKQRMERERPAPWDALPDIALYMDQIIAYMPRQLIHFGEGENLTSAMVNNYIKDGLLPRADGKRYGQTHLAYLTAICAMKQVLSVKEMKTLISKGAEGREPQRLYNYFCRELDAALTATAKVLDEDIEKENLARLACALALRSYADKLACERIVAMLQAEEEETDEKKQNKSKTKSENKTESGKAEKTEENK